MWTDVSPPTFECPKDMFVSMEKDRNSALVNLTLPLAKGKNAFEVRVYNIYSLYELLDNSGYQVTVQSVPVFPKSGGMKLKLGRHPIRLSAKDLSGNKAKCSFRVTVEGKRKKKLIIMWMVYSLVVRVRGLEYGVVSSNPEACIGRWRPNFVWKGGFLVVERVLRPYRWPRHC